MAQNLQRIPSSQFAGDDVTKRICKIMARGANHLSRSVTHQASWTKIGVSAGVFELCGSTLKIVERFIFIYKVFFAIPAIALGVRRAHDVGLPGWIIVVPFLNLSIFLPGSKGVNKYGAPENC